MKELTMIIPTKTVIQERKQKTKNNLSKKIQKRAIHRVKTKTKTRQKRFRRLVFKSINDAIFLDDSKYCHK